MRRLATLAIGGLLAGCTTTGVAPVAAGPFVAPPRVGQLGLDRVMGRDAGALVQLFGQPEADVREGTARKLQFVGNACILDAYLYPKGSSTPLVSHVDTRLPSGGDIDKATCVAALSRRR